MTDKGERGRQDRAQFIIHNQLVSLELPDLARFGIVPDESSTAKHK